MDWDNAGRLTEPTDWSRVHEYLCGGVGNSVDDGQCPECGGRLKRDPEHGLLIGGCWWQWKCPVCGVGIRQTAAVGRIL